MRRTNSSRLNSWQHHVIVASDDLAAAQRLPVCLHEVARVRRVKKVVFCSMPQEGMTAVEKDGFLIYIKCDPSLVDDWSRRWCDPADGGRTLPTRTRFSIAHEIGHTLFFDVSQERIRTLRGSGDPKTKESVEWLCNIAASRILLPEKILLEAAGAPGSECRLLDPAELVSLRRRAAISPRALVLRLDKAPIWGVDALISCVRGEAGQAVIEEVAMPPSLRGLFPHAEHGQPAARLTDHPSLLFNGGQEKKAIVDIPEVSKQRKSRLHLSYAFACERIYLRASGYFVTAKFYAHRRQPENTT